MCVRVCVSMWDARRLRRSLKTSSRFEIVKFSTRSPVVEGERGEGLMASGECVGVMMSDVKSSNLLDVTFRM